MMFYTKAIKLRSRGNHTVLTIVTITTQRTIFTLAKAAEFNLCGYIMTQTTTSQTLHTRNTARANIQGKIKNIHQQSQHICLR